MLFNIGLEMAIKRGEAKIAGKGIQIDGGDYLTNIRYADDLILYASNSDDLRTMLELQARVEMTRDFRTCDFQRQKVDGTLGRDEFRDQ